MVEMQRCIPEGASTEQINNIKKELKARMKELYGTDAVVTVKDGVVIASAKKTTNKKKRTTEPDTSKRTKSAGSAKSEKPASG